MLALNNRMQWEKLDSPFRNSGELPELIEKLAKTFDLGLLVEITTEYITHQMSLYEVTFAVFPYLIKIGENTEDKTFQLETLLSTTVMLSEYGGDNELEAIFSNSKCSPEQIIEIKFSFKEAFRKLKHLVSYLEGDILPRDESERKYFLLALAVANEIYSVSSILWRYHENEEYGCGCPNCDETFILWNEEDKLVLYKEDPVFTKDQEQFAIHPSSLMPSSFSKKVSPDKNYAWLSHYIDSLGITSLKTTINYLFGTAQCPYCEAEFEIFENIQ